MGFGGPVEARKDSVKKIIADNAVINRAVTVLLDGQVRRMARLDGDAYRQTMNATVAWTLRDMRTREGAFCSSLDADSEHEEGKFYVWTADTVEALLVADEWALARRHWGLDRPPNFEHEAWHLRVARPLPDVARELGMSQPAAEGLLEQAWGPMIPTLPAPEYARLVSSVPSASSALN